MTTMELIERGIGHNCLADAYDLGRADKYQEITSEYMLLTAKQVAEIRADAIDSCKTVVMETIDNELLVDTLLMRMDKLNENNDS